MKNTYRREFEKCLRCGTTEKILPTHTYCRKCFLYIVKESKNEVFTFFCETCGNFFKSTRFQKRCSVCENKYYHKKDDNMYIYLATDNSKLVKIGKTKDIHKRLQSLKTGNPHIKYLFYFAEGGNVNVEKTLHSMFMDKRVSGEWFCLEKSDIHRVVEEFYMDIPVIDMIDALEAVP